MSGPNAIDAYKTPLPGSKSKRIATPDAASGPGFGEFLKASVSEVSRLQREADRAVEDLTTGKTKDIHSTMIKLEKASVSLDLMLQVRNKIIAAYDEVKRMQV
jgi:flagellar hook-basal body complex protein FliE